jgi:hypothetical protein|tara:strand:+ start:3497 stop:3922 length:426 start_codon:yes stop_codon:yes gene_type:complete
MANIGEVTELVNNEKLTLEVGSDTYILMQDVTVNIDRPISRETTSGGGVVYFYGSGDNFIQFTLLCSTPEIASLNTLTQRNANGGLTSTSWKIVAKNVSGASKTITAAGTLPHLEVARLAGVGGVVMRGRIQLTGDTISVA